MGIDPRAAEVSRPLGDWQHIARTLDTKAPTHRRHRPHRSLPRQVRGDADLAAIS
jgi:hypothetical protein